MVRSLNVSQRHLAGHLLQPSVHEISIACRLQHGPALIDSILAEELDHRRGGLAKRL